MAQVKKSGTKVQAAKPTTAKPQGPKTVVEQTFRSVSQAERCLVRWIERWSKIALLDTDEGAMAVAGLLKGAVNQVGALKAQLEKLHSSKWVAPKAASVGGNKAPELAAGQAVWIRPAQREEYLKVFSELDLTNLFIDQVIGEKGKQRILVRIGPRAEGGKVARVLGFTPKGHLTTIAPKAEPVQEVAKAS